MHFIHNKRKECDISAHIYIVQCLRKVKPVSAKHCHLFMVNTHIFKHDNNNFIAHSMLNVEHSAQ